MRATKFVIVLLVLGVVTSQAQSKETLNKVNMTLDKIEIVELINRYANNTDNGDVEKSVSLFTNGGFITSPVGTVNGHAAIREHLREVNATVAKGKRHIMTNITSEIDNDTATSSSYMMVVDAQNSTNIIFTGVYFDRLVKEHDIWKFSERFLEIDPSFYSGKELQSEIVQSDTAKVVVLFGGSPARRDEVIKLLSVIDNTTFYGTLSEEEGMAKIADLEKKVDLVLIGGRYTKEQRARIKAWVAENMPKARITQPGFDYQYTNKAILENVRKELDH